MFLKNLATLIVSLALAGSLAAQVQPQPKMGAPLSGLSPTQLQHFLDGFDDFGHTFSEMEGLGPIFNQNSCASCHNNPVGGTGAILVTRFGLDDPKGGGFDPLESLGGSLLQANAITIGCEETIPQQANVIAQRLTTSILGAGLIEAIPDADIVALANNPAAGISGRVHMVPVLEDPMGPMRVGRYGWKAQLATVLSFSGDATLQEMGITNRLVPNENAPNGNLALLASCDLVPDPEDGPGPGGLDFIDRVTNFQRYLAPPPQTPRSGMSGEALFVSIGCAQCHTPGFTTRDDPTLEPALRNKAIRPYSDFLLHDMGVAADFIEQGGAAAREIKTPPLWGVRVRDPMWHDGRVGGGTFADRIAGPNGIIELHDALLSESRASAQAFAALSQSEKDQVLAFLDSLGRVEFDADGDNRILRSDLVAFQAARTGPGSFYTPDDPEAVFDVDQDGDVDDDDFDVLVTVYEEDCNNNGVNDLIDIVVNGTSYDSNANLMPDECDFCQTNLGFGGPGNMELSVCGDDLTLPASVATAALTGAQPNASLYIAVSNSANPLPVSGGTIVPLFPFLWFTDAYSADGDGNFAVSVEGGGGPTVNYVIQVASLNGSTVELSNAVQVETGM